MGEDPPRDEDDGDRIVVDLTHPHELDWMARGRKQHEYTEAFRDLLVDEYGLDREEADDIDPGSFHGPFRLDGDDWDAVWDADTEPGQAVLQYFGEETVAGTIDQLDDDGLTDIERERYERKAEEAREKLTAVRADRALPEALDAELDAYREDIDALTEEIEELREQRSAVREQQRESVVGALEAIRQELGDEDQYPLIDVAERGRMSFDYEEVLTADGVETTDGGYHDWDGAIGVDEYLERQYRGTTEHIEKLADRLAGPDDDLPRMQYPIHA